jgi:thiamine-phosphate pyrophosphorylase
VNDRVDVALASGADGVHLPAASLPSAVARRLLGPVAWIGRSTHAADEAEEALDEGADYVVLGPICPTPSKEAFGPPLGIAALTALRRSSRVLAIGGIDATNAAATRAAGAHGVAVIRAVLDAPDPAAVVRALRAAIDGFLTA